MDRRVVGSRPCLAYLAGMAVLTDPDKEKVTNVIKINNFVVLVGLHEIQSFLWANR